MDNYLETKNPAKVGFLQDMHTTGKILNFKNYLAKFWDYYQSSPLLQKSLANVSI